MLNWSRSNIRHCVVGLSAALLCTGTATLAQQPGLQMPGTSMPATTSPMGTLPPPPPGAMAPPPPPSNGLQLAPAMQPPRTPGGTRPSLPDFQLAYVQIDGGAPVPVAGGAGSAPINVNAGCSPQPRFNLRVGLTNAGANYVPDPVMGSHQAVSVDLGTQGIPAQVLPSMTANATTALDFGSVASPAGDLPLTIVVRASAVQQASDAGKVLQTRMIVHCDPALAPMPGAAGLKVTGAAPSSQGRTSPGATAALNPQPLPPGTTGALNPQPLPPGARGKASGRALHTGSIRSLPAVRKPGVLGAESRGIIGVLRTQRSTVESLITGGDWRTGASSGPMSKGLQPVNGLPGTPSRPAELLPAIQKPGSALPPGAQRPGAALPPAAMPPGELQPAGQAPGSAFPGAGNSHGTLVPAVQSPGVAALPAVQAPGGGALPSTRDLTNSSPGINPGGSLDPANPSAAARSSIAPLPICGRTPAITRVNGHKSGGVFTPDTNYNLYTVEGCNFGERQGRAHIYGRFARANLYPMDVAYWSDQKIELSLANPNAITGEPDANDVTLVLELGDGQQLKQPGFQFYAARESVLLSGFPPADYPHVGSFFADSGRTVFKGTQGTLTRQQVEALVFDAPATVNAPAKPPFSGTIEIYRSVDGRKILDGEDYFYFNWLAPGFTTDSAQLTWLDDSSWCSSAASAGGRLRLEWKGDDIFIDSVAAYCTETSTGYGDSFSASASYSNYALSVWVSGPRGLKPWAGQP